MWQVHTVVITAINTRVYITIEHKSFFFFTVDIPWHHDSISGVFLVSFPGGGDTCSTLLVYCHLPGTPVSSRHISNASADSSQRHRSLCGMYSSRLSSRPLIDLHRCSEPEHCFDLRADLDKSALI